MHRRKCVKFMLNLITSLSIVSCIIAANMYRVVLNTINNYARGFISFGFLLQYYSGLIYVDIFSRGDVRTYPHDYIHNTVYHDLRERQTRLPKSNNRESYNTKFVKILLEPQCYVHR